MLLLGEEVVTLGPGHPGRLTRRAPIIRTVRCGGGLDGAAPNVSRVTDDTRLREITSHAALLALTGNDPFVRWGIPSPLGGAVLAGAGAVAVERFGRRGRGMWVIPHNGGGAPGIRALLEQLREGPVAQLGVTRLSVPQEYAEELAATFATAGGGDWDWMWSTSLPPTVSHEDELITLDDTDDAAEIATLSSAHSPDGEGDPGRGRTHLWLGLRCPDGELVAAGAMQLLESGVPHLAGIVTHTGHRGRGLGRAVSTGLTRHAVLAYGVCTLGMYSSNPAARALYAGLGYRTAYSWHSRRLAPTS